MNIAQENRVIAAVGRFEKMEREIVAKKPLPRPVEVSEKPKDLTPIEIKQAKKKADEEAKVMAEEEERIAFEKAKPERKEKEEAETE